MNLALPAHCHRSRTHAPGPDGSRLWRRGELINQFSIASITHRVFQYASQEDAEADQAGAEVGILATLEVAAVVFDELQTGIPWDVAEDPQGYNFRFTLPAARRPAGGVWHRVEIWLTPSAAGQEPYPLVWLVKTTPLASI